MGALAVRIGRWVALTLSLAGIILFLSGGRESGAMVSASPDQPAATTRVYLPRVGNTQPPPRIQLVPFTYGFDNITITDITHAGDERLFVAIREGRIWIVNPNGSINPTMFLDIKHLVRYQDNFEQGLLGLAFHPDYPATPYFYIAYTTSGHVRISRGTVNPATPNVANAGDLKVLMTIRKPESNSGPSPVHNAGDLAFGPDGYLYIPLGDGGPDPYDVPGVPGDPNNNSQRRDTLLGSILRIDPDPTRGLPADCGEGGLYSIPHDNPWLGDDGCDEIWVMGLRNPWRMSIDPLNGDFYIADVGEWLREEVNYLPGESAGGQNFGWHCWEGTVDYTLVFPEISHTCNKDTRYTFPVFEYDHANNACSVIGGRIYRGAKYPALYGRYFFGDWCTGQLWTMYNYNGEWRVDPAGSQRILFSTFGEDVHGELYTGGYGNGTLYKVVIN